MIQLLEVKSSSFIVSILRKCIDVHTLQLITVLSQDFPFADLVLVLSFPSSLEVLSSDSGMKIRVLVVKLHVVEDASQHQVITEVGSLLHMSVNHWQPSLPDS